MADDKNGRDEQARNADRRQRERAVAEELERMDETEPPVDPRDLEDIEAELETMGFPATGSEIVAELGAHEVASVEGTYTVEELIPDTDAERFEVPAAVRDRVQRPTIAAAMKRIVEASQTLQNAELSRSQREAYERTLRELKAIDADDEDAGIRVVTDWIVERIAEKERLPGSRDVRRRAAKFCRQNGYEVRNDEWLGV